jgi:hypothetical protein
MKGHAEGGIILQTKPGTPSASTAVCAQKEKHTGQTVKRPPVPQTHAHMAPAQRFKNMFITISPYIIMFAPLPENRALVPAPMNGLEITVNIPIHVFQILAKMAGPVIRGLTKMGQFTTFVDVHSATGDITAKKNMMRNAELLLIPTT